MCYIGESGRPIEILINEHKNFTGPSGKNAVYDHKMNFNHVMDYTNCRIMRKEDNISKRKLLESLFINSLEVFENNKMSRSLRVFN